MSPEAKRLGKFTLVRELGRGGMGVVYLARDNELGRDVALKMLLDNDSLPMEMERFRREARAAAKLKHPNIVPVYETGTEGGKAYFTMEFVKGRSMERGLEDLAIRRRLEIVRDVAAALHFAHGQGVVHRDIKPANIILAEDGRPVVMDFGLAKQMGDARNLTAHGTIMGTPNFMSPEQATGDPGAIDARSDVFSLGAVMYFFLTGKPPFERADTVKTVLAVLHEPPLAPRRYNPAIPRDVETICLKALSKKPAARFQSAGDFAADIDRHLKGAAIVARPPSAAERGVDLARRHPTAALGILAIAAAAVVLVFERNASRERDRKAAAETKRHEEEAAVAGRRAEAAGWVRAGREQLDLAERCMMTGRADDLKASLPRAVRAYSRAVEIDPQSAEGFAGRGRAFRLTGSTDEAWADLSRAVALDDRLGEAWYERGLLLLDSFIDRKNAAQSEPASAGEPSLNARLARSRQLAAADDLGRAATLPSPAGRDWMPLHARAALAFLAAKLPEASAGLDEVIGKSPFRDDALALRAYIRLLGSPPDVRGAVEDLDRAVQANALSAAHRNLRGVARGLSGDAKGALEDFDAAVGLDAGFWPARLNRSSARLAAADSAGAEADAGAVLAGEKDNLPALRARGEARFAQRDFAGAEADFTRAVEQAPGANELRVRRAAVYRLEGKYEEALADAKLATHAADPEIMVRATQEVVDTLFARSSVPDWQRTLAEVETALAAGPRMKPDEFLRMARALKEHGSSSAARAMLQTFLKQFPDDPRAAKTAEELKELESSSPR